MNETTTNTPIKPEELGNGMKVHYCPKYGRTENGIIKSHNTHTAFVVYKCNDDWDNYHNYTGVSTRIEDLRKGWDFPPQKQESE